MPNLTMTGYKGITILSPDPVGTAGIVFQNNFKYFADQLAGGGVSGISGYSGFSGYSGQQGATGPRGPAGNNGIDGANGQSGISGYSGFSGFSGATGANGFSGFSGYSGLSGYSGFSGVSGFSGRSGYSGFSGPGANQALNTSSNVTFNTVAITGDLSVDGTFAANRPTDLNASDDNGIWLPAGGSLLCGTFSGFESTSVGNNIYYSTDAGTFNTIDPSRDGIRVGCKPFVPSVDIDYCAANSASLQTIYSFTPTGFLMPSVDTDTTIGAFPGVFAYNPATNKMTLWNGETWTDLA